MSSWRSSDITTPAGGTKTSAGLPLIVAKTHYILLRDFLANDLSEENRGSRKTAREKIIRLTLQQFQELSTDVHDELMRRNRNNSSDNPIPFLPFREDLPPKRNQARQKLATLPQMRFKDLSSDVYYEIERRWPELPEKVNTAPSETPGTPTETDESTLRGESMWEPPANQATDKNYETVRRRHPRWWQTLWNFIFGNSTTQGFWPPERDIKQLKGKESR